jgi:hypothetical protein
MGSSGSGVVVVLEEGTVDPRVVARSIVAICVVGLAEERSLGPRVEGGNCLSQVVEDSIHLLEEVESLENGT